MSTLAAGAGAGAAPAPRGFGPTALATPANALTLARFLATPAFIAVVASQGPGWLAVAIGLPLVATDILDGWIARRMGTTRSGAFLDPLADKLLVIGSLFVLVARGEQWWLPVAVITARELAISVLRSRLARRGISVPATALAKLKTLAQDFAVGFSVLPLLAPRHLAVARGILWLAVVLSVWSGLQYIAAARQAPLAGPVSTGSGPP
jgi:CDP-diacylglycerol--glycerol-3-phosphate 3-phosphatidyltransferase